MIYKGVGHRPTIREVGPTIRAVALSMAVESVVHEVERDKRTTPRVKHVELRLGRRDGGCTR